VKQIEGLWWPDDVGEKWQHSLRHVESLTWALEHCLHYRTAVQAGGNIGLWPRRLAERFQRVLTFEPDDDSRACLERNVPKNVEVHMEALGDYFGKCAIKHKSLGSHRVDVGLGVDLVPLDSFNLSDVDLIQFDIEGYEWHALMGAEWTVKANRPLIQLELRDFSEKYGHSVGDIRELLERWDYAQVSQQPGSDFVFLPKERIA